MQKGTLPSWLLMTDAPRDLNFAIYVACSFDLLPDTLPFIKEHLWSAYPAHPLETSEHKTLIAQWKQWWDDIVDDRAQNELHGRWIKYYSPDGHFSGLPQPLGQKCEAVFPSFRDWWGMTAGGQKGVNYWDKASEFQPIVKQVETELERAVQPFRLKVDYVYTGLGSIVDVSSTYAIMSVHRPNASIYNNDWWLAKVRELA
ncbi:hypothetical protein [Alicyclobacillus dauci]|uniref:Uncharacterized protein n=1 Tax=Alicyclobacillus dauci TaxID=1475485 RepID=A0ABY6Z319_9BACL|nr:hypothetical protein [Alicyclobacillus dauci]WAH37294.1 hypothetical protein NZD86_01730 [Alicyclobacillus dauci]